ncbi:MAG: hypothetical protein IMHGJWDQ_000125 [Candidatus Fervidibacter sp.]
MGNHLPSEVKSLTLSSCRWSRRWLSGLTRARHHRSWCSILLHHGAGHLFWGQLFLTDTRPSPNHNGSDSDDDHNHYHCHPSRDFLPHLKHPPAFCAPLLLRRPPKIKGIARLIAISRLESFDMPVQEEDVASVIHVALEPFRTRALVPCRCRPRTPTPSPSALLRVKALSDRWGSAIGIRPTGQPWLRRLLNFVHWSVGLPEDRRRA